MQLHESSSGHIISSTFVTRRRPAVQMEDIAGHLYKMHNFTLKLNVSCPIMIDRDELTIEFKVRGYGNDMVCDW